MRAISSSSRASACRESIARCGSSWRGDRCEWGSGISRPATRSGWCARLHLSSRSSAAASEPRSRPTGWARSSIGLRRENERLSLSVDNLADVLAPDAAAPALELAVEEGVHVGAPLAGQGATRESELGEHGPRLLRQQLRAARGRGCDDRRRRGRRVSALRAPGGRREGHDAGVSRGEYGALLPAAGGGASGSRERDDRAQADAADADDHGLRELSARRRQGPDASSRGTGSSRTLERSLPAAAGLAGGALSGAAPRTGRRPVLGLALAASGRRRLARRMVALRSGARASARPGLLGRGGEVSRLEIDPIYGARWIALRLPFRHPGR